jgi:hypothetical protein
MRYCIAFGRKPMSPAQITAYHTLIVLAVIFWAVIVYSIIREG